jgi:hypothetical protein
MRSKTLLTMATVGATLAFAAAPAVADVITFDGVGPGYASHPATSPYVELDYSISAPGGLYYLGTGDVRYAGENNLFDSNYDNVTTLTTVDAKPFDIQSIDLAEMYFPPAPADEPTTFTGTLVGGGTVTQTFDVENLSFLTYDFSGFNNLTSLSWTATGPYTPQFANIHLSTVPEPGTWAMLALGVFSLGATLRTRRGAREGADGPRLRTA